MNRRVPVHVKVGADSFSREQAGRSPVLLKIMNEVEVSGGVRSQGAGGLEMQAVIRSREGLSKQRGHTPAVAFQDGRVAAMWGIEQKWLSLQSGSHWEEFSGWVLTA